MKIAIVGGGITGCITALACREAGYDCTLYEMSGTLGGVMADLDFRGRKYFNGCHYFDRGTPWFEALLKLMDFPFEDFAHEYGAITALENRVRVEHDYAQPAFACPAPAEVAGDPVPETLSDKISVADRLQLLGPDLAKLLLDWAAPFGDLSSFHVSTARVMQLHRFYFPNDLAFVRQRKLADQCADDIFGIPRRIMSPDDPISVASLPATSYDDFFQKLRALLEAKGAVIVEGTPVVPKRVGSEEIEFIAGRETIVADKVVWCCNPTGLFLRLGLGRLDAPVTRMYVMVADLEGCNLDVPKYYHSFSLTNPIIRLYVYDPANPKLVVEAFDIKDQAEDDLREPTRHAEEWLGAIGLDAKIKPVGLKKQRRYQFFTINDAERFLEFDRRYGGGRIVSGRWGCYSRDEKIAEILKELGLSFP